MRQQDRLWSVGGPWVVGCEGLGLCIDVLFGSCLFVYDRYDRYSE